MIHFMYACVTNKGNALVKVNKGIDTMKASILKIALAWALTLAFALVIVKGTSIGEVILVISEKHGMGVHTFDLIVFVPALISLVYTAVVIKNTPVKA